MAGSSSLTTRVIKAIGLLGSAQAINILCSIVRTKLTAIWLGPAGVGLNSILTNGSQLVGSATQLNIRDSSVRDVARLNGCDGLDLKCRIIRRWAIMLGVLGAAVIILLSPLLSVISFAGTTDCWPYFAALAPFMFFSSYSAGELAILQGCSRLRLIARINVYGGLLATSISILLLYFYRMKAIPAVIDVYAFSIAFFAFIYRYDAGASQEKITVAMMRSEGKSFIKLGLSMSVSALMLVLVQYIFASYLNSVAGETGLGIYQSGYTLVNSYVGIIFTAIGLEYYPRLTRFIGRPKHCRTIVAHEMSLIIYVLTPVAIAFLCMSEYIVKLLYSSTFEGTLPYITYAMVGTIFRGIALCFTYRILAQGDSKAFILTECVSAVIGLSVNIIAYHYWSYTGLGVSYIVWYGAYMVITGAVCYRRYRLSTPSAQLWLITISIIILLATIALKQAFTWWLPAVTILPVATVISLRRLRRRN